MKKKAKEDIAAQDANGWNRCSGNWPISRRRPRRNRGSTAASSPISNRPTSVPRRTAGGKPAQYQFPHKAASSTKRIYKVQYGGEVIVSDRWRAEFGEEIKNPDQHFRIVYLTCRPTTADDAQIAAVLNDTRIAVARPEALCEDTREALADLIAAEQMKRNSSAPNQTGLRDYAETKRREAVKAMLKDQLDEFRRGKVLTQKGYGIPTAEIFKVSKESREADLGGRLVEKAYETPLFSPKDFKKDFTDADAKKVYAGLFHKEPGQGRKRRCAELRRRLGTLRQVAPRRVPA